MRWALMGGLGVVLLFQAFRMAYRDEGYDFTSYLLVARALRDGGNPYQVAMPFPYLYPLFLAFALMPLTFVPVLAGGRGLLVACLAGLVASCLLLERAGLPGWPGRSGLATGGAGDGGPDGLLPAHPEQHDSGANQSDRALLRGDVLLRSCAASRQRHSVGRRRPDGGGSAGNRRRATADAAAGGPAGADGVGRGVAGGGHCHQGAAGRAAIVPRCPQAVPAPAVDGPADRWLLLLPCAGGRAKPARLLRELF